MSVRGLRFHIFFYDVITVIRHCNITSYNYVVCEYLPLMSVFGEEEF